MLQDNLVVPRPVGVQAESDDLIIIVFDQALIVLCRGDDQSLAGLGGRPR